jgi:F-type H+-transporting ATPase subunit delta
MAVTDVSKEYAEALFALAEETGEQRAFMTALETVTAALDEHPELRELIASPAIACAERVETVARCFGALCPETVVSFLQLLCEKGRITLIDACVKEYRRLLDISTSVIVASVTSAVPLNEKETAALAQKLSRTSGRAVQLSCTVDPSLLGGVIVAMDGRVIDGSLRHRLQEVKEVISHEHKT